MERAGGILLPISSIPSDYGIGCFSEEAYNFVDKLVLAGQKYWQILPLGPTGYGDSPYQSFSTFAGNPYFIDPKTLIKELLLTKEECDSFDFVSHPNYVEYGKIYESRFQLLWLAYKRFDTTDLAFLEFCKKEDFWLSNYARFMVDKEQKKEDEEQLLFWKFLQYEFTVQWQKLKSYANEKGIKIIGDIPIYVASDSADAWGNPALFQLDTDGKPTSVAGCPPDAFSEDGQLWGNPLYDWEAQEKTGFSWWIERVKHAFHLYDVVRIDHFRGFDEYYSIPAGDETAKNGHWEKGPGIRLFQALQNALGNLDIIAEDLGYLTPSVYELLAKTGYPGMKVLQFAFDPSENSTYLPHKYNENFVVYTGTHDNDTTEGWYRTLSEQDKKFVNDYLGYQENDGECFSSRLIRVAMASKAKLCIIPLQDYLALGSEARINHPSTLGDNWKWRCSKDAMTEDVIKRILRMTRLYGR